MFVRVNVEIEFRKKVPAVPVAAVINRKGEGIYLADNESGKVSFVKIKPGIVENDWMEIREPDIEGAVVTLGQHLLRDGSPILIAGQGKAASGSKRRGGQGWKGSKEGEAKKGEWQGKKSENRSKGGLKGRKGGEEGKKTGKKKANQESGKRDSQG
jgi:hypothetical protein